MTSLYFSTRRYNNSPTKPTTPVRLLRAPANKMCYINHLHLQKATCIALGKHLCFMSDVLSTRTNLHFDYSRLNCFCQDFLIYPFWIANFKGWRFIFASPFLVQKKHEKTRAFIYYITIRY